MNQLPAHLQKYIVEQNFESYTYVEHATWRFALRQLRHFLAEHAHHSYLSGLEKTGITIDRIPKISDIDLKLRQFGWRALPVSGFIPPAAFMELQSLSVLPIALGMRALEHLGYTPAPDIVHEAAGHAPLLADPEYASYLKKYAHIANKAIVSKEDLKLYEAIRILSDIKEDMNSGPDMISEAQQKLDQIVKSLTQTSEASLLSRMNWWTAEYGLIGDLQSPKIFGAGLLSSVGESKWCLSKKVRKLRLTVDCIKYSYDITEPQPQLFVTPDFKHLEKTLDDLSELLSYRRGGLESLKKAQQAETVTTFEFENHLQVSGVLTDILVAGTDDEIVYLKTIGPTQISFQNQELSGQGIAHHSQGFGVPVGSIENFKAKDLVDGSAVDWHYESGVRVQGVFVQSIQRNSIVLIATLKDATVTYKDQVLFEPSWGPFDLAFGQKVISVFAGAADREKLGRTDDFIAALVPTKNLTARQKRNDEAYKNIREARDSKMSASQLESRVYPLFENHRREFESDWLFYLECFEVLHKQGAVSYLKTEIFEHLKSLQVQNSQIAGMIQDGLDLIAFETQ